MNGKIFDNPTLDTQFWLVDLENERSMTNYEKFSEFLLSKDDDSIQLMIVTARSFLPRFE